jgi:hypothetical protein
MRPNTHSPFVFLVSFVLFVVFLSDPPRQTPNDPTPAKEEVFARRTEKGTKGKSEQKKGDTDQNGEGQRVAVAAYAMAFNA